MLYIDYIALAIDPWALAIAYRSPIDCLLLALSIADRYGPGHGPGPAPHHVLGPL